MEIKIKYHTDKYGPMEPLQIIDKGDWIDVRAAKTVGLKMFDYEVIPLGFSLALPDGYEAHLLPRSSTLKKFGIIAGNSMGIIDNSYCSDEDEWGFLALAMRDTVICKGDRIAQFRIEQTMKSEVPGIHFEEVDHLEGSKRGGFGSTGTNEYIEKPTCSLEFPVYDECIKCSQARFDDGGVYCIDKAFQLSAKK